MFVRALCVHISVLLCVCVRCCACASSFDVGVCWLCVVCVCLCCACNRQYSSGGSPARNKQPPVAHRHNELLSSWLSDRKRAAGARTPHTACREQKRKRASERKKKKSQHDTRTRLLDARAARRCTGRFGGVSLCRLQRWQATPKVVHSRAPQEGGGRASGGARRQRKQDCGAAKPGIDIIQFICICVFIIYLIQFL